MPKKETRCFNFVFEIFVESPGDLDEAEAMEDASEFATAMAHTKGRVGKSFCSVTRVDEYLYDRPPNGGVVIKGNTQPPLEDKIKNANERLVKKKTTKAKPTKVKGKKAKRF